MKRNYVILSTPSKPKARMREMTPAGLESSPQAPKVDVSALDPKTAADVASKKSVKAVAPVIPMKLIAPVALDNEGPAVMAAETETWGIKAVGANTSPFNGDGIVVAVLDSGIDPAHPAFNGVELVRRNFTQEGDDDQDGHGTHCAGTIFGRDVD